MYLFLYTYCILVLLSFLVQSCNTDMYDDDDALFYINRETLRYSTTTDRYPDWHFIDIATLLPLFDLGFFYFTVCYLMYVCVVSVLTTTFFIVYE